MHDYLRASQLDEFGPTFDAPTPPHLAGAWEVVAECSMAIVAYQCCSSSWVPIYSIVVRRGPDDVIRVLAWRELPIDVVRCSMPTPGPRRARRSTLLGRPAHSGTRIES